MTYCSCRFIKPVIFILILCLFSAGCISRTDVQPAPATPVPTPYVPKGPAPLPSQSQVTVVDDGSKTCSQLQGTVVIPGQVCPGTWLTATDSFSCCSKLPVAGKTAKSRLTVEPLDLRIAHNVTFVDIGTG